MFSFHNSFQSESRSSSCCSRFLLTLTHNPFISRWPFEPRDDNLKVLFFVILCYLNQKIIWLLSVYVLKQRGSFCCLKFVHIFIILISVYYLGLKYMQRRKSLTKLMYIVKKLIRCIAHALLRLGVSRCPTCVVFDTTPTLHL